MTIEIINKGEGKVKMRIARSTVAEIKRTLEEKEDHVFKWTRSGVEIESRNGECYATYEKKYYAVVDIVEKDGHIIFDIGKEKYLVAEIYEKEKTEGE